MLALRDQENLAHAHQTTAAGKPLNQDARGLRPKTPFRGANNDENRLIGFGGPKTAGKGGNGKLDKMGFITPVAPRTRAPLGMKTTNAKAQAFKTPGPPQQTLKPEKTIARASTGRRSAKSKIVVAPAQKVHTDVLNIGEDEDVPEIEYAPPPPIELPDPPMEFGYDETFPQFQGMNMMRGYGEVYGSPKDKDGKSIRQKEEDAMHKRLMEKETQRLLKSIDDWPDPLEEDAEAEREVEAMIAAGPKVKGPRDAHVDSIQAKSAATALSQSQLPLAAMKPTASSIQKRKKPAFSVLGSKPSHESMTSSTMRASAAAAVSRNTIGYPKARKPASIIPKLEQKSASKPRSPSTKVDQRSIHPKEFRELYGEPPVETDMWFRLREYELLEQTKLDGGQAEDDLADELFDTNFFPTGDEDDDELFQLPLE